MEKMSKQTAKRKMWTKQKNQFKRKIQIMGNGAKSWSDRRYSGQIDAMPLHC